MIPMQFFRNIPVSLLEEDWERIRKALQCYIQQQEALLKTMNCGDREWEELEVYVKLEKDIEVLILGNKR